MGKRYGQFCPVAMAAEVLCERWVPLVLREVMYGSTRFSDIARGVPLVSRGLLAQRLRELEDAGVLESDASGADLHAFTEVALGRRTLRGALPQWLPLNGEAMQGMGIVR